MTDPDVHCTVHGPHDDVEHGFDGRAGLEEQDADAVRA
ncbi:hypothetical protein M2156_008864 [Streptomyces sp. SAI-149]|jgi:hypothetical protein|nr:hypothetical protein [Streptomyces sp. SAI-149]